MAETDSDTALGLEQIPLCRQRTSPIGSKQKMNSSSLRQQKNSDDSAETKWIPTADVAVRRYSFFFFLFDKQQNEKKKADASVGVNVDSFFYPQ